MADAKRLKVRVDQDKCQGHNRCKAVAPELFVLDEYGNALIRRWIESLK